MANPLLEKEHFNLYYIYKEDKERNSLPQKTIEECYKNVRTLIAKRLT